MEGKQSPPKEAVGKGNAAPHAYIRLRPRRRRKHGRRKQAKFPQPVRLALWLGLPIGLWAAIYAFIQLFQ